jgi:hypothetical protein
LILYNHNKYVDQPRRGGWVPDNLHKLVELVPAKASKIAVVPIAYSLRHVRGRVGKSPFTVPVTCYYEYNIAIDHAAPQTILIYSRFL